VPADKGSSQGRILIVDDVEINRKLLRAHLQSEGFDTLEADDGAEALVKLQREPVDAIVSDILMPNMDGYRLCAEVRASPKLQRLPFVVYSATYVSLADEQLSLEAGADRYFRKPSDVSALISAVKELVRKRRPAQPRRKADVVATPQLKTYDENLIRTLLERVERLAESERRFRRITIQVFRTLGRGAAAVLYQSGLAAGGDTYTHIQNVYKPQGDGEFAHSLAMYAKLSGLGDFGEFRVNREASEIHVAVAGTFEPSLYDSSRGSVCHFLRGILSGVGAHLLQTADMQCRETMCEAMGARRCEFVVKRPFVVGGVP